MFGNINSNIDTGGMYLSEVDVLAVLSSLDNSFSLAPDNIPPLLLKSCRFNLAAPLCYIFNMSLQQGIFLDTWKHSFITPLHKSGSKGSVENYRPIAKLQLIPKVFEAIVKNKLYSIVRNHISEHQHGFMTWHRQPLIYPYSQTIVLVVWKTVCKSTLSIQIFLKL